MTAGFFLFSERIPFRPACQCGTSRLTLKMLEKPVVGCSCGRGSLLGVKVTEEMEEYFKYMEFFYHSEDQTIRAYLPNNSRRFDIITSKFDVSKMIRRRLFAPEGSPEMKTFVASQMIQMPIDFGVQLLDHQLKTISWMHEIEMDTNPESNVLINTHDIGKIKDGTFEEPSPYKPLGGILADGAGTGKTISMLGLIHYTLQADRNSATLIICQTAVQDQWVQEAKRCNQNFNILSISTYSDLAAPGFGKKLTEADLIIINEFVARYEFTKKQTKLFGKKFRRLILDELTREKDYFHKIGFKHAWILDGSLKFKMDVVGNYLKIDYPFNSKNINEAMNENHFLKTEFLSKFVLCTEVTSFKGEQVINEDLVVKLGLNERQRLKANYYPIYYNPRNTLNDLLEVGFEGAKTYAIQNQKDNINASYCTCKHKLYDCLDNLQKLFDNFPESQSCKVCSTVIPIDQFVQLPCSHLFCLSCYSNYIQTTLNFCPICRSKIYLKDNYEKMKQEVFQIDLNSNFYLHPGHCSTAMFTLYDCISNILKDPDARIMLSSGNYDLNHFIRIFLCKYDYKVIDINYRLDVSLASLLQNARICILDPVANTIGLNCPEVTHLIFLEPSKYNADYYEKYCLARVRGIANDNPIKVIRIIPTL
jgi:hypothetical protein